MPTLEELWEVQLKQWPDSVRLTPQEVIEWTWDHRERGRPQQVLMTIQYPPGVFYRIPAKGTAPEYRGFRFGIEGHEYLSFY